VNASSRSLKATAPRRLPGSPRGRPQSVAGCSRSRPGRPVEIRHLPLRALSHSWPSAVSPEAAPPAQLRRSSLPGGPLLPHHSGPLPLAGNFPDASWADGQSGRRGAAGTSATSGMPMVRELRIRLLLAPLPCPQPFLTECPKPTAGRDQRSLPTWALPKVAVFGPGLAPPGRPHLFGTWTGGAPGACPAGSSAACAPRPARATRHTGVQVEPRYGPQGQSLPACATVPRLHRNGPPSDAHLNSGVGTWWRRSGR